MPEITDTRYASEQILLAYIQGDFEKAQSLFEFYAIESGEWALQCELLSLAVNQGAAAAREYKKAKAALPYLWCALEYYPDEARQSVFSAFYHQGDLEVPYDRLEHTKAIRERQQLVA